MRTLTELYLCNMASTDSLDFLFLRENLAALASLHVHGSVRFTEGSDGILALHSLGVISFTGLNKSNIDDTTFQQVGRQAYI